MLVERGPFAREAIDRRFVIGVNEHDSNHETLSSTAFEDPAKHVRVADRHSHDDGSEPAGVCGQAQRLSEQTGLEGRVFSPYSGHMALRKIAQLGEPVLRQIARRLTDEELSSSQVRVLVDDMIDTMRDADGAGLAAPQIYESIALVVIEVRENTRYPDVDPIPLTVLANPTITPIVSTSLDALADCDAILAYEGCLSVPGLRGRVRRPRKVRVQAVDPTTGRLVDEVWEGFRAVVVQHETDHLTGMLFVDRTDTHSLSFLREYDRYVARDARVIDLGVPPAGDSR